MRLPGSQTRRAITVRLLAAVIAGYAVSAMSVAVLASALSRVMGKADAVWIGTMPAFVIYTVAFLYAFGARSAGRAWFVLLGATAFLAALRFTVLA